jgi:hypothetical protein
MPLVAYQMEGIVIFQHLQQAQYQLAHLTRLYKRHAEVVKAYAQPFIDFCDCEYWPRTGWQPKGITLEEVLHELLRIGFVIHSVQPQSKKKDGVVVTSYRVLLANWEEMKTMAGGTPVTPATRGVV